MSLLNKPIEDVIQSLYDGIKSKKEIIVNFRKDYKLNDEKEQIIKIARLKLVDFSDEFEITVSQSLQAILTLKAELCNLIENKEGKLINSIFDSKIDNSQINISNINNTCSSSRKNNISKNEKEEVKREIEEISDNINKTSHLINNIINETKLNFDYSKLMTKINKNESELSLITNPNNNNFIKEKNNNILKEEERLISETDFSEIMQDDNLNNRNDINNISISSSIKVKNNENKKNKYVSSNLLLNYTNEPEPEIEHMKIPIRQSLRQINSNNNNKFINKTENNINSYLYKEERENILNELSIGSKREVFQNKVKKLEKENKIKNLISKINEEESYKVYLGNKYGGGHYNIFINKLNNNEIDFDSLEKEVEIIRDLVNTDRNIRKQRNNNFKNNNSLLNNSGIKNRKNSNHSRRNSKENNNKINDDNPNEYIEPINFANFLRGDNNNSLRKKSKKRSTSKKSLSKEKK